MSSLLGIRENEHRNLISPPFSTIFKNTFATRSNFRKSFWNVHSGREIFFLSIIIYTKMFVFTFTIVLFVRHKKSRVIFICSFYIKKK